eukprot:gb/GECG01014299.1/.p1 GENE.gb/GECG01014299.1/~~gb/GECG01014299.1/.p1  ORF type:complete len:1252 (+),score=141.26 gb/GECG01014299.1/:1-3756(+)
MEAINRLSTLLEQFYSPQCDPYTKQQVENALENEVKPHFQSWQGCYTLLSQENASFYAQFYGLTLLQQLVDGSFVSSLSPQDRKHLFTFLSDQKYFRQGPQMPSFVSNKLCMILATMIKMDPTSTISDDEEAALYKYISGYVRSEQGEYTAATLRLLQIVIEECTSSRQHTARGRHGQSGNQQPDTFAVSAHQQRRASRLVYSSMSELVALVQESSSHALHERYSKAMSSAESPFPTMLADAKDQHTLNRRILVLSLSCLKEMIGHSPPSMEFPTEMPQTILAIMQSSLQNGQLPTEGVDSELFEQSIGCVTELCRKRNWRPQTQSVVLQCIENVTTLLTKISRMPTDILVNIADTVLRECLELLQCFLENHIGRLEHLPSDASASFIQVIQGITRSTHSMYREDHAEIPTHMHTLQIWHVIMDYILDCQERQINSALYNTLIKSLHEIAPWILSEALFTEHDQSLYESPSTGTEAQIKSSMQATQSATIIYGDIPGAEALHGLGTSSTGRNRRSSQKQVNSWMSDAEWELYGSTASFASIRNSMHNAESSWTVLPGFIDREEGALHQLVKEALSLLLKLSNIPAFSGWIVDKVSPFLQNCASVLQQGALTPHGASNEGILMDFSTISILGAGILAQIFEGDVAEPQSVNTIVSVIVNSLDTVMSASRDQRNWLITHVQVAAFLASRSLVNFADVQLSLVQWGSRNTRLYIAEADVLAAIKTILRNATCVLLPSPGDTPPSETVQAAAVAIWGQIAKTSTKLRRSVLATDEFQKISGALAQSNTSQSDAHTLLTAVLCRLLLGEAEESKNDHQFSQHCVSAFQGQIRAPFSMLENFSNASEQELVNGLRQSSSSFLSIKQAATLFSCICRSLASEASAIIKHWYQILSPLERPMASLFQTIISNPDTWAHGSSGTLKTVPPKNVIVATTLLEHFFTLNDAIPSSVSAELACEILTQVSNSLVNAIRRGTVNLLDQQNRCSPSTARLLLYFLRFLRSVLNVKLSSTQMNYIIPTILEFCLNEMATITEPSATQDAPLAEMSPVLHFLLRNILWNCSQFFCKKEVQQPSGVNGPELIRKVLSWKNDKGREAFESVVQKQLNSLTHEATTAELVRFHLETWRGMHDRIALFSQDLFEPISRLILQACCRILLEDRQVIVEEDIMQFLFELLKARGAQRIFFALTPAAISQLGENDANNKNFTLATALSLPDSKPLHDVQAAVEIPSENDIYGFEISLRKCLHDIRSAVPHPINS